MSVSTVKVFRHGKKENWSGVNQVFADALKEKAKELINVAPLKFNELKFFLMDNAKSTYNETTQNVLSVFVQAEPENTANYVALHQDSNIIGYYHPDTLELYLSNTFNTLTDTNLAYAIAEHFSIYMEEAVKPFNERNSWINKRANPALRQRIRNYLSASNETIIREAKERVRTAEQRVEEYTRKLKEEFDKRTRFTADLAKAEQTEVHGLDAFIQGLDQIAEHPRVSKLDVEDSNVVIGIDGMIMFARVERADKQFYLGDMEIKIDMSNTNVRFFNKSNARQGYWTRQDPHPHVNGENGRACLGNVGTTIAELCSNMEIYALFLVCMDFLENANTEDPAGRKVVNWDECDAEGNVLAKGGTYDEDEQDEDEEDNQLCPHCEEYEPAEDFVEVLVEFDASTGAHLRHEHWCEECANDESTSHGPSGERVADGIYDRVNDYYEAHA